MNGIRRGRLDSREGGRRGVGRGPANQGASNVTRRPRRQETRTTTEFISQQHAAVPFRPFYLP